MQKYELQTSTLILGLRQVNILQNFGQEQVYLTTHAWNNWSNLSFLKLSNHMQSSGFKPQLKIETL